MDESTKNYRKGELSNLNGDYLGHYKIKVIGADTETKWLSIDQSEFDRIAGDLTDDETAEASRALATLLSYGYAVQAYGPKAVHTVLGDYMLDNTSGIVDTVTYRDEITRHVMAGDDWAGILDTHDTHAYLWDVIEGTHHDHPEWFPELRNPTTDPFAEDSTPDLMDEYITLRIKSHILTHAQLDRCVTLGEELRKRGVIN